MEKERQTYRFKLSSEIVDELYYFAKLHEFDERKQYKEAWKLWMEEKRDEIIRETNRLNELGYKGDIENKLYISARYYYKNKKNTDESPKQKKRRKYVPCNLEMIVLIDEFLKTSVDKPKDGFTHFMEKTKESPIVLQQIQELTQEANFSREEIYSKLKKTYKNRYYIYNK